ncbi:MAG: non-canonical purine NTP pyrophosphatase [Rickettsiales bacterium]|nr:non-canonical purine NTP pyrophosphatase [Rickettsiales bacterium]
MYQINIDGVAIVKTMFLASSNYSKIREISAIVENFGISLKSLLDLGLESPEESGKTFEENALLKARFGFEKTGLATIADDSGFCVKSLGGFPGIFSARFAEKNGGYHGAAKLLNELLKGEDKKSYFVTLVAFVGRNTSGRLEEHTFWGKVGGKFVYPPRGNNGFGYCPYFMPVGSNVTYGEIDNLQRAENNQRSIALRKFADFIGITEIAF